MSVDRSIVSILTPEVLKGQNQYNCSQCKQNRDATRGIRLKNLPDVLQVVAERGVFDLDTLEYRKDNGLFEFDLRLNLAEHTGNADDVYDLCSVITHEGDIYEGKYQAIVRDVLSEVTTD